MHRRVVLLALVACAPTASLDPPKRGDASAAAWVYAPPVAQPLGAVHGRLGRSQAPQPIVALGIAAAAGSDAAAAELAPLEQATAWPIPGDGPARAAVYGWDGDHPAVDLIDIDGGWLRWRDASRCAAPIVATTAEAIVCGDAGGTRALDLEGTLRWATPSPFLVATGGRIAVNAPGGPAILDAATGDELTRIALPRGVAAASIVAACGETGRELLAFVSGRLARIADAQAGPAITWSLALGPPAVVRVVEACAPEAVVVSVAGPASASLIAIERDTGKLAGRIDGALGWWAARDGSDALEVATAQGVARYPRRLDGSAAAPLPALPPLGELLAARADRRLLRASPLTAVLLDRDGVRGYLPLAATRVALGDAALLATHATDAPSETLHRLALPPRWTRRLRLPPRRAGVAVDAELRDLPPLIPLDDAAGFAQIDTGMHGVVAHAIDPGDSAALYAVAVDRDGERAAVACADLAAKQWRWQRVDGCGPGTPIGLAVAREVVVCGASGTPGAAAATVRATSREGAARWAWSTAALDAVIAGGSAVAVHDAGGLTVLDAGSGRRLGHVASDDGAAVRVAIVALDRGGDPVEGAGVYPAGGPDARDAAKLGGRRDDAAGTLAIARRDAAERDEKLRAGATLVITAERGRVVARLVADGLPPAWSIAVAGVVRALAPAGAGVLVALEDGDAYRIDLRTAAVTGVPGLGLRWRALGDLVLGDTAGGPIPGIAPPPPPPPPPIAAPRRAARPLPQGSRGEIIVPPPMSTPITPPPPLGDSWQLTLYELGGGLRARNDYALPLPANPAVGGPAGSPILVTYGPDQRELVVIDPRTGDPLRRVRLPDAAPSGLVFGTVVGGAPVAGTLLASPLRVVLF